MTAMLAMKQSLQRWLSWLWPELSWWIAGLFFMWRLDSLGLWFDGTTLCLRLGIGLTEARPEITDRGLKPLVEGNGWLPLQFPFR